MKPEELLIPRYKVIDDFPFNSYYKVGGIITDPGGLGASINENGYPVIFCEWEDYPNIFKKLSWWQERDEKDFPKYVKNKSGKAVKVEGYANNSTELQVLWYDARGLRAKNIKLFTPATEEDYLKSKQIKANLK